ncbi:MAG: hypothetical protein PHO15_05775, partial [Eubacteriales bacterium]|nr:hypothetical protein [Eubacteriales bacterium]
MNILGAKREGGNLIIAAPISDIMKFLLKFKPGEYEIVKSSKKRSNEANNYMWSLAEEIAKATGTIKEDVYRHAVRQVGSFYSMEIDKSELDQFKIDWASHDGKNKIAWFVDVIDYADNGRVLVFAYKGSSVYNTKEFSRLVDFIVSEAKDLDIETLTPAELE